MSPIWPLLLSIALHGSRPVMVQARADARIHGRVSDPSGAVIVGADIVVTDQNGNMKQTKTDRQGAYTIAPIAAGTHGVMVSAAGFADGRQSIAIAPGQDLAVNFTLAIAAQRQTIVVEGGSRVFGTDPTANANATVIGGKDLDALSDDPNELETQLHMLAGAAAGPLGAQIYVDGFKGGKLPPKSSILEIRVNQNPYSAEYDAPGSARVEVITKPGGRSFHGRFMGEVNPSSFNSRNPFLAQEPAYRAGSAMASLDGPLGPNASFSFAVDRIAIHDASAISAIALDPALNPTAVHEAFPSRHDTLQINPRVDAQLGRDNMLSVRYRFFGISDGGTAVGQFALPSQALGVRRTEHDVQLADVQVIDKRTVNDARVEVRQSVTDQTVSGASVQTVVIGAFTDGPNASGEAHTALTHVELQDALTTTRGPHTVKVGGVLRVNAASDATAQNVNGTFTFPSLDAYRATELGLREGLGSAAIRQAGGGASQFSIVYGRSRVGQTLIDGGAFAEDDWRISDRVTIGAGLRYEIQSGIATHGDVAPRGSIAWAIGPAKKNSSPATVFRAGAGIFYDRVPQSLFLQSLRLNGTRTQQFIVSSPDFYPVVPSAAALAASERTPTPYTIDPSIAVPRVVQAGVTLERRLVPGATAALGYVRSGGSRQLFSRSVDGRYEFTSGGRFAQDQLTANLTIRTGGRFSVGAAYRLSSARGDTSGPNSFATNPADLEADEGRTPFDVRQHLDVFMGINGPGFRLVPSIFADSGQPFDVTVGEDLNGDSIFNDRPAFATDVSRPTVIATPLGVFDTAPIAGQRIVPRNYGTGPAQVLVNLRAMKPFVVHQHDIIRIDLVAINLLNRANLAQPVGNLSSPLFGRSTALAGGGASSSNRQIRVQLQFTF